MFEYLVKLRFFLIVLIIIFTLCIFSGFCEYEKHPQSESLKSNYPIKEIRNVLYKTGNDLILYDTKTEKKTVIMSSPELTDFDLSEDQNFIAYSLRETGFDGNSDIYIKDLKKDKTVRLTEKNNIASINPVIYSDNGKVAYVRRTYNTAAKYLSGGEIWVIDLDGNKESSKRITGFDDESFKRDLESSKLFNDNGEWTGEYQCLTKEDVKSVKIGITKISPDGLAISYWQKQPGPECSGLWSFSYITRPDNTNFFKEHFIKENVFKIKSDKNVHKEYFWSINEIIWFDDGSFVIEQSAPGPFAYGSICYINKEQSDKWVIYDDSIVEPSERSIQIFLEDMIIKSSDIFIIAYCVYNGSEGYKYYAEELNTGDKINYADLSSKKYFASVNFNEGNKNISGIRFLDIKSIVYIKQTADNNYSLCLYDIEKNAEKIIEKSPAIPVFKL